MSFYKVLVIGDVGVGKTSMVNRIVYNTFSEKYKATIGCEFGLKILEINGESVRIQLWDLAGQDRLGGISRLYCRDANGAIVVNDVTREGNLKQACAWKNSVDENVCMSDGTPIPMVLCANKADLLSPESSINKDSIQNFALENKFVAGFLTSSKTGENTNEALMKLVEKIMAKNKKTSDPTEDAIKKNAARKLEPKSQNASKKSCCS
jgi:small GTP-binding protein